MTRNSHIILIMASTMAGVPDQASYKVFVTTSAARDVDQVCISSNIRGHLLGF